MFKMWFDFDTYKPCYEFHYPMTDWKQVRSGFMFYANPNCPIKANIQPIPDLGSFPLPPNVQFVHLQQCGCKNGTCNFCTKVTVFKDPKITRDLWKIWADPKHDHQIGKWFDRNDGVFLKLRQIHAFPSVGSSCALPTQKQPCGLTMEPGITYIAFWYSSS